jgi:hypothetical protein
LLDYVRDGIRRRDMKHAIWVLQLRVIYTTMLRLRYGAPSYIR